ncbi:MAG: histidine kinase, partial [Pseudomonadota bacterium]|nr:histidine kinase [Pseudomonadota bacterium]
MNDDTDLGNQPIDDFLVVGIGASAGGVDALQALFAHVPPDSGMAFVVVLHLSPTYESELTQILQRGCPIPVEQVRKAVRVQPNHVYVLAPNCSMTFSGDSLAVSPIASFEERRAPIDIFFRTLADSLHARAASVVLSGTGADGSMGMKRIKESGGICLVQDPAQAQYDDMPRHCIATNLVDYILPVEDIPARLVAYVEQLKALDLPASDARAAEVSLAESHEEALRSVVTTLRVRSGHDFGNYKRSTLLRRIARRTSVRALPDLPSYAEFLRDHPEEAQPLLKDLLISVTNFFRDAEAWKVFEREVIPRLFADKGGEDHVRVWVAGCATGEEAYSIAMLLCERAAQLTQQPSIQVFATDIDEDALAYAREGTYTINDAADVSPERLRRFFNKKGDAYSVRRELRELVLFANHNLLKDPPFSHLDLASCRNLLIYFNRTGQRRALEVFHYALEPGGYLLLGRSESVEDSGDLYVETGSGQQTFQRRAVEPRLTLPVPDISPKAGSNRRVATPYIPDRRTTDRMSYGDLHERLLEAYAPPSLLVSADEQIVHMSRRAGRYLQLPGGEPTHDLLKLIRPELRLELRTALHEAMQRR